MDNCTDKELVIQLQKDDVKSFDILYLKYHQVLYRNINKLTKNIEATQDILQEVFISLWEKRRSIDQNKPVLNWLMTVSYNKSVNYLKNALRESLKLREFSDELEVVDEWESNRMEIRLYQLEKAVNNLSPQKNKVFNLCKLQGKSYNETARELNISRYTVKEYLGAAVLYIKEYIKRNPGSAIAFFYATSVVLIF